MSGGKLVVLDRAGREVKQYDLPSGSAILGSDSSCDIRIMLPCVRPHHATVLVQANQSVIRNVGSGETLLNGVSVSVAALRQDDVVSLGGRELVWRYADPAPHHARRRPDSPALQSVRVGRVGRASRGSRGRRSEGAGPRPPHASHRDSAPAAVSTRQVAIVQPQRRDTADHIESVSNSAVSVVTNVRRRGTVKSDSETDTSLNKSIEEMNKSKSPKSSPINLQNTTKATLWIESRKSSPRKSLQEIPPRLAITPKKAFSAKKSTPLRMAVLKKAQSAQKMRVTKIQAPLTIDHTKQAAIMLMTGHTPKAKASPRRKASLAVAKRPRGRPARSRAATAGSARGSSASDTTLGSLSNVSLDQSPSVMEISDSDTGQSTMCESDATQTGRLSSDSIRSSTVSPIKSALKDPRKSSRKTESIKFDLSNLDEPQSPDDKNIRLRYSESPSPRSVQTRARDILRRTLGSEENITSGTPSQSQIKSPSSPRLARGSLMLHRALRTSNPNRLESYSIVDLVSGDSNSSLYGSASDTSRHNSLANSGRATRAISLLASSTPAVPKLSRSRSAVSSTSFTSFRDELTSQITYCSEMFRLSKSLSTQVNTPGNDTYNVSNVKKKSQSLVNAPDVDDVTFNVSRRSRQSLVTPDTSKENLTDNKSLSTAEDTTATLNASTKSRRTRSSLTGEEDFEHMTLNSSRSRSQNGTRLSAVNMTSVRNISESESPKHDGTFTPKSQQSPEEAGTPVLSIQSLLDSDKNATMPQQSKRTRSIKASFKRKTIGGRISLPRKRGSVKSKSLRLSTRASNSSNISPDVSDNTEEVSQGDRDTTPKSAVKLVQEAVKNKHSTAKKPKSKRSIIDHLNESDIVKQLFNSPVKRKLSQSMIEYSRRQDLDGDMIPIEKVTRKTIAFGDTTPYNSISEQSQVINPEVFVSPLRTASASPEVEGVKRLFAKSTPENDLRNVRGVKKLMQTPRLRRSVRNDLTQVSGVKAVFARSPKNRLSDVRVKEVFAASPKNDLRRVSGVKLLFQTEKKNKSPKNDLSDVANVRNLYKKSSPRNDLGNVSGVKRVMRRNSPRNDLGDVRGVRNLFHLEKQRDDLNNISGIEELFSESHQNSNATDANSESSFNLLIGMPAVRSYTSKAKSFSLKAIQKPKHRKTKSLQASFSSISNNVENWLENELRKRMHNGDKNSGSTKKALEITNDENMFDSKSAKSDKSSSIISRSMSRSKHILELSMSGRTGRKSASYNTNTTVEGNKFKTQVETPRKSVSKSKSTTNRSRELLKLATDTVEGNTPLLATRIRHSTLPNTTSDEGKDERIKSTSEIYSPHTLPIKKRSLVDRDTSGNRSEKSVLPIKKRAVVHSTPVKGRFNLTMNASGIGRVSPIAPLIEADINPINRNTQESNISPKRKLLLTRSSNVDAESEVREEKTSPVAIRSSRRQTKQSLGVNNVKKRKPVLSPKSSINSTNVPAIINDREETPKKRLPRTRNVQAETSNQPDNTQKRSKSIAPSNGKAKPPESQDSAGNTRNTRKYPENNAKQLQLEAQPITNSRRGRNADIQSSKVESNEPETRKRSTRGTGLQDTKVNSRKLKKTASKDNSKVSDSVPLEKSSRGRKRKKQVEESPQMINKSKTDDVNSKKKQKIDKEPIETKQRTRGRPKKNLENNENIEVVKESATRRVRGVTETIDVIKKKVSRKNAESKTVQSETTKTSKKSATGKKESEQINNETDEISNVRGRKRQPEINNKQNTTESQKTTRRGRGGVAEDSKQTKPETEQKRTRRQQVKVPEKPEGKTKNAQEVSKSEEATVKTTSRQKVVEPEKTEVRATRGGVKTTEPQKPTAGRKRKNNADGSTRKESPQSSKTRKTSAVSPKAKRARNTKVEEPQKPATRSRRR